MTLQERLQDFKKTGFTVFPKALDDEWVQAMRRRYSELQDRTPSFGQPPPGAFTDLLELEPQLSLRAITIPEVLDFAEALIGPYVQLESITALDNPSQPIENARGKVSGWHRDMFGQFPEDGHYHRPLLFNAMIYLQDLTESSGPLRVIPGSHCAALSLQGDQLNRAHPDEQVLCPRAGDVVLFHSSLLHTGSPNTSGAPRIFFCVTYNHAWLKYRANYSGPRVQALIHHAHQTRDRRLLRLLGIDDQLFHRANSGYVVPDEEMWQRWTEEDELQRRRAERP